MIQTLALASGVHAVFTASTALSGTFSVIILAQIKVRELPLEAGQGELLGLVQKGP